MSQSHPDLFPVNPNIIFMGTPDFSVPPLKALIKEGYNISAVVTQPDRKRGRGKKISYSPVKEVALDNNLKVIQRENISDREFIDELRSYKPDIFIVTAFGQILNTELISVPGFGAVNIHASLLPKYRGAAPIQWAILNNDPVTGITIMKMARKLDAGPILMKEEVQVRENETSGQLFERLSDLSGDVIVKFLKDSAGKILKEEPQEESSVSYTPKTSFSPSFSSSSWAMARYFSASLLLTMLRDLSSSVYASRYCCNWIWQIPFSRCGKYSP